MTTLNDLNPDRIIIAGDWHSNAEHAVQAVRTAYELGVKVIVHVGDFGWNHKPDSAQSFIQPLEAALQECDVTIVWVDGNWDNHTLLRSLPVRTDGFVQTGNSGRLFWAPRAHRWIWNERVFAASGGAYSVRTDNAFIGYNWHPEFEEVKTEDVTRLGFNPVDVLFTHEVPAGVPVVEAFSLHPHVAKRATLGRNLLRVAVENVKPKFVFSGHWHQRLTHEEVIGDALTSFNVLNREHETGNLVVLTLQNEGMMLNELACVGDSQEHLTAA